MIGRGSFGIVYHCRTQGNDVEKDVAIKKVFLDHRYKSREVQCLKDFGHMNIVEMKEAFSTKGTHKEQYVNIVMEYLPTTVHRVIKHYNELRQPMPLLLVKLYAFQMFKALAFIHSLGYCHRDIKP